MNLTAEVERIDATTVVVKLTGRMNLGMRLHEVESTINKLACEGTKEADPRAIRRGVRRQRRPRPAHVALWPDEDRRRPTAPGRAPQATSRRL